MKGDLIEFKKRKKYYCYREKLDKLELTTFIERRVRGNLIETFKIIEFLIMVDIFSIFLLEMEIYCQDRFIKQCLLTNRILFFCL